MKSKLNKNKEIKRQKKKANKNHAIYSAIYLSRSSLQFDLELFDIEYLDFSNKNGFASF